MIRHARLSFYAELAEYARCVTSVRSERRRVEFECAAGHPSEADVWAAVDWDRQPRLAREVLEQWEVVCDRCHTPRPRTTPLIAVDRLRDRRVALLLIEHDWHKSEPPTWAKSIAWLKPSERFVVAPVPMGPARRVLAERSPAQWLNDPIGTVELGMALLGQTDAEEIAFAVRFMLEQLHGALPLAAMGLLFCENEDDFREHLSVNAGLVSPAAETLLRVAAMGAPSEQHLELAEIVGPPLGSPRGWESVGAAAKQFGDRMVKLDEALAPIESQGLSMQARSDGAGAELLREVMERTPAIHSAFPNRVMNFAVSLANVTGPGGDSRLDEAEAALRAASKSPWLEGDPDLKAQLQMNLALVIIDRRGDPESVSEAIDLARDASQRRTRERGGVDWAYSSINLGVALVRLGSEAATAEARLLYEQVASAHVAGAEHVPAMAKLNLLRLDWAKVFPPLEEVPGFVRAPVPRSELMKLAAQAREIADDLNAETRTRGDAYRKLADVYADLNEDRKSEKALLNAVDALEHSDVAAYSAALFELGLLYARRCDWKSAAGPLRDMLNVTGALVSVPGKASERTRQMAAANRRARFAAAVFAEADSPEEAVVAIENGRTRELRWRLALTEGSESAAGDPRIRARAAEALAARRRGFPNSEAAMRAALEELRLSLGAPDLGVHTTLEMIQMGASRECPLVYVNPVPSGCWMFVLDGASLEAHRLAITGTEIARLVTGIDPSQPAPENVVSYAFATTGEVAGGFPYLSGALASILPRLGEAIAAPIAEALERRDATRANVVAGGPLATVPIAAATWGNGRCLLDTYAVSTTPSATLHASCRRRAATRPAATFSCLVATADPSLPSASAEIETAAAYFAATAIPSDLFATGQWLAEHAREATVLHTACHGFADLVEAEHSGLVLADGPLTSAEIARLDLRQTRLAVASACETGVIGIGNRVDEALSVGSALLEAGAACSVASLWPVSDEATGLLMARFYEVLRDTDEPVAALAESQRWLRGATDQACADLADRLSSTGVRYTRRAGTSVVPGGHVPFADPAFWASFVALGA